MSIEERFAEYLRRLERGEEPDLESWLEGQEPDSRDRLRALAEVHARIDAELAATQPEPDSRGPDAEGADSEAELPHCSSPSPYFFRARHRRGARAEPGLEPGRVIDDFRLVAVIGEGGMGQVWEAEQLSLGGRRVALKFVRRARASKRYLEFFRREARAGGRLSHPNIVSVHGHGESGGLAWIAMEHVEGAWTLAEYLAHLSRSGEVPEGYDRRVAQFVAELADALQAAHDAGVIHRDLKPGNVLITPGDRPKLTDFGLARITDEGALSQTGEFAGSYFYMSPEQAVAQRMGIDHRTDVFSLGAVLYEMLTLQRPFRGDTPHQITAQILTKEPPDPRTVRSRVPRDLVVICGKALEKDRDKRYQSMAELAQDLRRHLADESILARPPTAGERAVKWARRNPRRSAVGAVALLSFVLIGALLLRLAVANEELELRNRQLEQKTAEAEREAASVRRLSALRTLQDLLARAESLFPPHPSRASDFERWIEDARRLADGLEGSDATDAWRGHRAELAELRAAAVPPSFGAASAGAEPVFASDFDAWRYDVLSELVSAVDAFADERTGLLGEDAVSPVHGWSVPKRLAFARRLRETFAAGGGHAAEWELARAEIRGMEVYGGLDIAPQIGLVPIGADPDSGLHEFWHVASGARPARDPRTGRLALAEESGLVLVLLPGGSFRRGAQAEDPEAPNHDPEARKREGPVRLVQLAPFLLAKHEMTQGQWTRLYGDNPSRRQADHGPRTALLPVQQVSWVQCMELLPRFDLSLPSEAQWEYGTRGGTDTPWWTGADRESLRRANAANLADGSAARAEMDWLEIKDWPELEDGSVYDAYVGTYAANPFGLHETTGNVWEWCLDGFDEAYYERSPASDPVCPPEGAPKVVNRGGGFSDAPADARSAARSFDSPSFSAPSLGVRPAWTIQR